VLFSYLSSLLGNGIESATAHDLSALDRHALRHL
jgi:hypothetical protein